MILAIPVAWTAQGMRENSARETQERVDLVASQTALRLREYLESHFLSVGLLQHGMETGIIASEEEFREQSIIIQKAFGGFQALNWINHQYTISWVVPMHGNEAALGKYILDSPNSIVGIQGAARTNQPGLSQPIESLFQGGRGFATYFPVRRNEELLGFVNGVFRTNFMLEEALNSGVRDLYSVHISDKGMEVYSSSPFEEVVQVSYVSGSSGFDLLDRHWDLELRPLPSTLASLGNHQPLSFLLGGISFCLAIAAGAFFFFSRRVEQYRVMEERRLVKDRLAQAQKMEAVGQLAGGVAHDFNNLLTAIAGSASLAALDIESGSAPGRHLKRIVQACKRAAEMTSRLLTFSRTHQLDRGRCHAASEMLALEGLLKPLLREGIKVSFEVSDDLETIPLAPSELGQIVLNLVTNAMDALPDGGSLSVVARPASVDQQGQERQWLYLCVSDNGSGMPREVQERAFEPFFTTKKAGEGTGLGLATVYGIVNGADGSVDVESAPDVGTKIHVYLPMELDSQTQTLEGTTEQTSINECNILVVEDEEAVRDVSVAMLESVGHNVVSVSNGNAAQEYLTKHGPVDLVFTDTFMPEVGGLELARMLRQDGYQGSIIITTGYVTDLSMEEVRELKASFLAKPFSRTELLSLVEYCLAKGDSA